MKIIHFTEGATDFLLQFGSQGARFVPLLEGEGDTHISCLHLGTNSEIRSPPLTHACALLVVHGNMVLITAATGMRIDMSPGMGFVVEAEEGYSLKSSTGAILIAVESAWLEPTAAGISTPARIAGQRWPGEPIVG